MQVSKLETRDDQYQYQKFISNVLVTLPSKPLSCGHRVKTDAFITCLVG